MENVGTYVYLLPFGIIYGCLVKFIVIWYIFSNLACLDHEKSGNPAHLSNNE
jgi:hypothetical protein